jgi:DNA-directed RNA polymerase sigma subunit (sigma70/sigma32)
MNQPNAVDQAIREWLMLNDKQFAFYMKNREQIQDLLRKRRSKLDSDDELKAIISDQIKQMMKSRKNNSVKIMDCQIFLHFNSDESGELTQPEIGKLAGLSKQRVGQSIASGIRKLRQHPLLKEGGELYDYFLKEDKRWLK